MVDLFHELDYVKKSGGTGVVQKYSLCIKRTRKGRNNPYISGCEVIQEPISLCERLALYWPFRVRKILRDAAMLGSTRVMAARRPHDRLHDEAVRWHSLVLREASDCILVKAMERRFGLPVQVDE